MKRSIGIFALITVFLFSCSRNPVTGKRELSLMSEQQEIALGQSNDPAIVAQFGLYQDDQLQKFIDQKGMEMAKISHRPDLPYDFKILDSPVVNAFAVPGGYVYFTRGIMAHFNNEAEFAGVLGHEIGHITAKHSVKQYSTSMVAQLGLIAGIIIKPELAQYMDLASTGLQLLFLKFGRDDESQSDELGVQYSTTVGYEAHEMADFFQTLDRLSGGEEGRIPTFMSTHPNPIDRYNTVHKLADQYQTEMGKANANLKVNRDGYLQMIDGLTYGEDPKQGYVESGVFYHPEMRFQYPIPSGWRTVNSPVMVQMAPSDGKALLVLRLSQAGSLQAASQAAAEELNYTVIDSETRNINGMSAIVTIANQNQDPNTPADQQTPVQIRSGFISYNGAIYEFHGLSNAADFMGFKSLFDNTIFGFRKLTDNSKINVVANKLDIRRVSGTPTLSSYLSSQGVNSSRLEEHAILNGMELNERLTNGMMVKVIEGDRVWASN